MGQKARGLHYTRITRLHSVKHFSLFGAFKSYEEIDVSGDTVTWAIFTTLMFFLTYEWAQKARTLHYTRIKRLPSDKHSSLFRTFIRYEEK
jgi:hypothetical protein